MWYILMRTYPLDSGVTGIVDEARGMIRVYDPVELPEPQLVYSTKEECQSMCDCIMGTNKH